MRKTRQLLLPALFAIFFLYGRVDAYELSGRISSDCYAYQGSGEDHFRPNLRFHGNMLAWRGADGRFVKLNTSLRWTSDFADKLPADPSLFVYDGYVHLSRFLPLTDVYAGRQFVYNGAGSALLDGGRVRVRPLSRLELDIFGGSSVSSQDPEKLRSLTDFLVVGGRLGARPDDSTRLGLSWMMKRNEGEQSFHRLGLDADRVFGPAEIFGRVSYNHADRRLAEILGRAAYHPGVWYFSGEYYWREPSVASNSIFSVIDFYRYQFGRVEARRRVWKQLSVVTHAQADLSGDEELWRVGVGLSAPRYSLSWIHQTGYGGENDGISGFVNLPLYDRVDCYASANLFRYRVQREQTDRSDAYATTVGVSWRPGLGVTVRVEGQFLRNAVLEEDGRLFVSISKGFSVGSDDGSKSL